MKFRLGVGGCSAFLHPHRTVLAWDGHSCASVSGPSHPIRVYIDLPRERVTIILLIQEIKTQQLIMINTFHFFIMAKNGEKHDNYIIKHIHIYK